MRYVHMYYYAIFWVLRRVTRFLLFNNILHSLLLFKKKHRKINIWIRHNFEAIGRISTKRLHPATCIQALVEHFEFEDFIHYVMGKIQTFIILTLVIRYIIYFEDKRSAPNMDSNTFNIWRKSLCFDTKKYQQIYFSLVLSILLPIFIGMGEHFAKIILFKLRTTGVFTQDPF